MLYYHIKTLLTSSLLVVINLLSTFSDPASSLECFYMESIVCRASKPTFSPNNGPFLPLRRTRILGVMTSQYGQGNYSCLYHIKTHFMNMSSLVTLRLEYVFIWCPHRDSNSDEPIICCLRDINPPFYH